MLNSERPFFAKGKHFQETAGSPDEARTRFNTSCNICSLYNLHKNCDNCPIATAHQLVIACFAELEEQKNAKKSQAS